MNELFGLIFGWQLADISLKVCAIPERLTELICHQCKENARGLLCTSCNKKGYCADCISKWYKNLPYFSSCSYFLRYCCALAGNIKHVSRVGISTILV
jgi:hypothetical protein